MKEAVRCKCYLKYCDDALGLARTKAEAWMMLNEYVRKSDSLGLQVKASYIVAPIAHKVQGNGRKKKRKRMRGRKRKKD